MQKFFLLIFSVIASLSAIAQDTDIILQHDLYHLVDRIDIRGYTNRPVWTTVKPYGRDELTALFDEVELGQLSGNEKGWLGRMRLLVDDSLSGTDLQNGIAGLFYRNQRDLYHYQGDNLDLYINPTLRLAAGGERTFDPAAARNPLPLYTNGRGMVIRGRFLKRIGFHTELADNQQGVSQFLYNRFLGNGLLAGENFIKTFGEENGLDYFTSRAYLTYSPWKNMRFKFGKDRAFWGNGMQSLLLSDHAADYLFLTVRTRFWKMEYLNHFTQLIDYFPGKADNVGTFPRKYGVFHQLSFQPNRIWSLSLFESVVYSPYLPNGRRGFELQYLNPILFFRGAEQLIGSPDNAFIGLNAKVNLFRRLQLYGQVLIDDFNINQFQQGRGFWQNKTGWQLGAKYIDLFDIPTLDVQIELNQVRPFTYQHFNVGANFSHYGQSLGHAAGANLNDVRMLVRFQPYPGLHLQAGYAFIQQGLDDAEFNYGGDISRPYIDRPSDFGNTVAQGIESRIHQLDGRISWQPWLADVYLDLEGRYRREDLFSYASIMAGFRVSLTPQTVRY
ncbi:MAG: hypothetical protein AAF206_22595 [Bacteroidota bacterium]